MELLKNKNTILLPTTKPEIIKNTKNNEKRMYRHLL